MNISVLSLLIALSSLEACLLLRYPLALGLRATKAGGAGRIGSGLLVSPLPHLAVWRDVDRDKCGWAVMVVVKVFCVLWEGERWRFGVRMLLVLTVRVVVSEVVRLRPGAMLLCG